MNNKKVSEQTVDTFKSLHDIRDVLISIKSCRQTTVRKYGHHKNRIALTYEKQNGF
jgi:hypothetical protein